MKLRWIALLVLVAMTFTLFVACAEEKKGMLTDDEAKRIAVESAGLKVELVTDLHSHFHSDGGTPKFEIHFNYDGAEYEYMIHARTGAVLSANR